MARFHGPRRGSSGFRGARRQSLWVDIPAVTATLAAAGGTITHAANAALLALRPFTIVRHHMFWALSSDQAAASETYGAALGVAVVSDEAVAVGVAAVPTPVTESASDLWLLHQNMIGRLHIGGGASGALVTGTIDSKAMRKVEEGQTCINVAESMIALIGAGSFLSFAGRFLIKLH